MRLFGVCYEELRSIRVGTIVGHGNNASHGMFQFFLQFIFKLALPNTCSSFPCVGWISSLNHEPFYVPMEETSIIVAWSSECKKILTGGKAVSWMEMESIQQTITYLTCFRTGITEQFNLNVPNISMDCYWHAGQNSFLNVAEVVVRTTKTGRS